MKKINIKAADTMPKGCKQPEPVTIEISGKISDLTYNSPDVQYKSFEEVKMVFDLEAEKLFNALIKSLPQGVIEPLTIKLLQNRVSLFHGVELPKNYKPGV